MILRRDALKKFQSFCQFIESRYSGSWRKEKQSYAKTKRFFNFIFAAAAAILYVSCLIFFYSFCFYCIYVFRSFFIPQPKDFYCTEDLFKSREQILVFKFFYY